MFSFSEWFRELISYFRNLFKSKIVLNFSVEPQIHLHWCWAAVGTSCGNYYNPSKKWKQCKLAAMTLNKQFSNITNCCKGNNVIEDCQMDYYLVNVDRPQFGSFVIARINNGFRNFAISFSEIRRQIRKNRLVAFRYLFTLSNNIEPVGHFAVINGYDNVDETVYLQMPIPFDPNNFISVVLSYNDFLTFIADPLVTNSTVTHSFYTKKRS